ncbi:hypothetical protein PHMEG_0008755 [Phytophthora megakarya]|uniref:Uncharacterized protein n=1 Tax=Phytophthora megakarya TaxID=4795 RepID=A0A225WJL4_9STRA|nr:hypothetical protein PHMEG_0008755 [Phytophthora megakarya]
MSKSGSDPGSPPISTPPDSPLSTGSHRSRQSNISRRSRSHASDQSRRLVALEIELRQGNLARYRLIQDRDILDLQVRQLRSDIRDMEAFQHGQREEITHLEVEISNLAHDADEDPDGLRTQVLQLRTERNDFERHAISARQDLHHAEADRDRLRQEAAQAGEEIRILQEQVRGLEREADDARSESATVLASYTRISTSLAHPQPDNDGKSPSSGDGSETHPSPHGSPGGSPGGGSPGGSPGGGSPLQLNPPLFPPEVSVPSHSTVRVFTAAEIPPWDPAIVGSVPIIAMIQATLTKRLPIPPGFMYPARTPFVRLWLVLRRNRPTPLTFDHNLHRRANAPLWRIAVSYAGPEEDHLIAYWESAHYLEITKAMLASDPDLFVYHQDRRQRRIRVGDRWRKLLGACLPMMRSQWADIDLLLDPYFLHLPMPQDRARWFPGSVSRATNLAQPTANLPESTDLITAQFECDQADPWHNHFGNPGTAHPSLQIPRLANKFNPPAAH